VSWIDAWRSGHYDETGWYGEVSPEGIFEFEGNASGKEGLFMELRAVAPGEATLTVRDEDGEAIVERALRAELADRVELVPGGVSLFYGDDATPADPAEPIQIVTTGTALFEARCFSGAERLYGMGALVASATEGGFVAGPADPPLYAPRDWLELSMTEEATAVVHLTVAGEELGTVEVLGVPESAVSSVEVVAEDATGAVDGELYYLLARAYDDLGAPIWGVSFYWLVDDWMEPGDGDLFGYYYDADESTTVAATFGTLGDSATMHALHGVNGELPLICQVRYGQGGSPLWFLPVLALLGWRVLRRRE
jgi:hypothetical protein